MFVLVCYLLLLIYMMKYNFIKNFKDLILTTTLIFSFFIVFITELLSLFKSLNLISVAISWSIFSLTLILILLRDKTGTFAVLKSYKSTFANILQSLRIYEKMILAAIVFCLLLLFFQGIIYPPNNW